MFINISQRSWSFPLVVGLLSIILSVTIVLGVLGLTQGYAAFEYRSSPVDVVPLPSNLI